MKTAEQCEAVEHGDKESGESPGGWNTILRVRPHESHLFSSFPRQGPGQTLPVQ